MAHSLCEFSKLCALRRGGSAKRRYDPAKAKPIDEVLWPEDLIHRYSRRGRTPVRWVDGRYVIDDSAA